MPKVDTMAAWHDVVRRRSAEALDALLADEVIFHSPIVHTPQVGKELTTMYLMRLKRYNPKLNNVVNFCDDLAVKQAKQADAEIAAGKYKGPLVGSSALRFESSGRSPDGRSHA